jgi:hypothetical protein
MTRQYAMGARHSWWTSARVGGRLAGGLIVGSLVGMRLAAQVEWEAIHPVFGIIGAIAGALSGVGLLARDADRAEG